MRVSKAIKPIKKRTGKAVVVATHNQRKKYEPQKEWHEYLDEAVERAFNVVTCVTAPTAKGYNTNVAMRDNSPLHPRLQRQVRAFINGFMACEETYQ
jgi:3-dehydroquinate dehydratase